MYEIRKTFEISAAHSLPLEYESKCKQLHGHNWKITVYLRSHELNEAGMVMDFSDIKQKISAQLDHKNLNEVLPFSPTAENMARFICEELSPHCYRAEVQESEGNTAAYTKAGQGTCPLCGCGA